MLSSRTVTRRLLRSAASDLLAPVPEATAEGTLCPDELFRPGHRQREAVSAVMMPLYIQRTATSIIMCTIYKL